ncbi:hypothetical protein [Deinococcus altitudinis]|uniref:hypothetical protein n=1 Tax=Deinococcus altitudinis TaxID=468914 RepID=UPI003891B315
MTFGFDAALFQLNRVPAPTWALTTRTMGTALSDLAKQSITEQLADMDRTTEHALQWAMTDPVATARFQDLHTYADGVTGEYYIGRQHFDLDEAGPGSVIVETECCLTWLDSQGMPAIYHRYLVILGWNLQTRTGQLVLAHDTDRDSQLAALTLTLIDTATLSDIPDVSGLDDAGHVLLNSRWAEFLTCVQQAAQEAIDNNSASGVVDDDFFPSRLTMTGKYTVGRVSSLDDGSVLAALRFTELQWMAGRGETDYLGYDLSVEVGDNDRLTYELWGSSSI